MVAFADKFAGRKPSFGSAYLLKDKAVFTDLSGRRLGVDEQAMSASFVISEEVPDRVGDVISIAGISLDNFRNNPIAFYNHQSDGSALPIGKWEDPAGNCTIVKEAKRAIGTLFFSQRNREAAQIFELVAENILRTCSIGFTPLEEPIQRSSRDPNPNSLEVGMYFPSIDLLEVSPTGVPCLPSATLLRSHLSRGKIAGSPISPMLRKSLESLAEPKPATVTSGFAAPAAPAPQSAQTKRSKPMSKRWGKPGRAKRLQAKHIRHETSRPEGHQWVLYSHDMSKVLGTHPTREAAEAQERAAEAHKNLNSSSGTAGGYAVAEEMKPEETKPEEMDHERIKGEIARVMEEHKGGDPDYHHAYYKAETGEVHHTVGDAAEEGHVEKVKAALEGIEGVKEVHQGDEHGPEGEGYEKVFPPPKAEEEEEEEEESGTEKPEEKAARVARRKAMLAFHVGRGKGFMVAAKALPKAKKDALETCVHAKIPKIAEDHPEMADDQRVAVAYSMCGEKAFDADSYSTKDDLDTPAGEMGAETPIAPDTTEEKQPPSLMLAQQAIENIESALPGMEPETRDFWEDILEQIRSHGEERYPEEDFGGEETAAETAPSADEEREFAEEVAGAYRESPEEREGAKRARASVAKSLRALRKGDAPAVLESAASHLHAISKHNVGRTLTKSEKDAAADHARSLDRLHGAVTHGMKAETESDEEQSIGALSASMPMDDDDEAAHEVEKLFGPVVRRAVAKQLQAAAVSSTSEKHLESLLERIGNVYGLRTE